MDQAVRLLQDQDGDDLAGLQLMFEMGMIYFDDGVVVNRVCRICLEI